MQPMMAGTTPMSFSSLIPVVACEMQIDKSFLCIKRQKQDVGPVEEKWARKIDLPLLCQIDMKSDN